MKKNCILTHSLTQLIWCAGNWSTCDVEKDKQWNTERQRNTQCACWRHHSITGEWVSQQTSLNTVWMYHSWLRLTLVNLEHISSASAILPARNMYLAHLELMYRSAMSSDWASSSQRTASLISPACCHIHTYSDNILFNWAHLNSATSFNVC